MPNVQKTQIDTGTQILKKDWLSRAMNIEKYIQELKTAYEKEKENIHKGFLQDNIELEKLERDAVSRIQKEKMQRIKKLQVKRIEKGYEYLKKIDMLLDEQYKTRTQIIDAITEIKQDIHRTILIARFVNCKPIFKIAAELSYSERHIKLLLKQGIDMVNIDGGQDR